MWNARQGWDLLSTLDGLQGTFDEAVVVLNVPLTRATEQTSPLELTFSSATFDNDPHVM